MCCIYSIICWSNKKIFLSTFSCFRNVFLFWKFLENPKSVQLYFGNSLLQVKLVVSLLRSSHDSLASLFPNCEKYLENFQNCLVFGIFTTQFSDLVMSGSSSRKLTQNDSWLPSWLACEWTSQPRKTLDNFLNILSRDFDNSFWWLSCDSF